MLRIKNNIAINGGCICAIASSIQISKISVNFDSNRAIMNGGAMYLGENSKIHLQKVEPDYLEDDNLHVSLEFTNNYAEKGGAMYVTDNTIDGVLCQRANTEIYQAECFIHTEYRAHTLFIFINTFFSNNTAHQSGSDIYGGQLDQCTINPTAELLLDPQLKNTLSGFDYIKGTSQIEHTIDYSQYAKSNPEFLISNISKSDVIGLISLNGILNLCSDNVRSHNHNSHDLSINKGELFTVSIAVVDQAGNLIDTVVSSSLTSKSGNGHFKGGQVEQQVYRNQCTELQYNVYPQDNSVQLHIHLYADGPCSNNIEVSRLTLNLTFLPCECPVGFQPSSSKAECICECDQRLEQHQIKSCFCQKWNNSVGQKCVDRCYQLH